MTHRAGVGRAGVTEFGRSSSFEVAYALHGIDVDSIVRAAVALAR
jgi:hypothetical protein